MENRNRSQYEAFSRALWSDLQPQGPLQELFAAEIVRAALRLRRCADAEATLAERTSGDSLAGPELLNTQNTIDRARAQAHGLIHRSLSLLRTLRAGKQPDVPASDEQLRNELPSDEPPSVHPAPAPPPFPSPLPIPRNAACPCGSGQKHKRCCGRHAPPVLFQRA